MIIAIVGPTGVGKTKMSVELAKKYNAVIINFDAVQVYKELNIGSAKVTEEEKEGIKHYLIDIKSPLQEYSVKEFQDDVRNYLNKFKDRNIILVGGTGLYLCAALFDYRFEDETTTNDYSNFTNEELYKLAIEKDKNMDIHVNNRQRLVRFLNKKHTSNVIPKLLYNNVNIIGLTTSRKNLYDIINKRVDKMMNCGLLEEVNKLYFKYPTSKVLHSAIGYKELIKYLDGDISLECAIDEIKKDSRHYAKRQYTWFNNKMNVKWFEVDYNDFNKTILSVRKYLDNKN